MDSRTAKVVLRTCTAQTPEPAVSQEKSSTYSHLSGREVEVLRLIVEGYGNQDIAQKLFISTETVKSHVRHLFEKPSVSDRTQAAVKAIRDRLV